jgi:hypothetical protein
MKFSATQKILLIVLFLCGLSYCLYKPSQIAKVNCDFTGCFGGGEISLTIFKNDTNLIARLEGYDKTILNAKISIKQLDTFKMFVLDLKNLNEKNLCTTVSHYTVYYQREVIRKTDSGGWEGFEKLINCLFKSPSYLAGIN